MHSLKRYFFRRTIILILLLFDPHYVIADHVYDCKGGGGGSPRLNLQCATGTIRISKGVCVKISDCEDLDPTLASQCEGSDDNTARWASYCAVTNPCSITDSCSGGTTCSGDFTYIYADYECIDETVTTQSLRTEPERQKNSLFRLVYSGRYLKNHVIGIKPGMTLVRCGAECNKLDDCVSFSIDRKLCQLNNRLIDDSDVEADDLELIESSKYYEKIEKW